MQIHIPGSDINTTLLLRTSFHPLAVIVDMDCEATSQILQMVINTIDLYLKSMFQLDRVITVCHIQQVTFQFLI
jgi:hypothetical protein